MEPSLLRLSPGAVYENKFSEDEGFGFVSRGRVEVRIESEHAVLTRGDCFYIFFDNSLVLKNVSEKPAEILIVNY